MKTVTAKMYEHHVSEAWFYRRCQHAQGYNEEQRAQFEKRANAHAVCATMIWSDAQRAESHAQQVTLGTKPRRRMGA